MHRFRLADAAATLAGVASFALAPAAGAAEMLVEGIAAQVGSEIVLASEVMELAGPVEQRLRQAGAPPSEITMVRKDALERLIENKLVGSVVERLELGADREEVDAAIQAIADENGLTIDQLLSSVASHGLTVDEYREKIRGQIEHTKVINAMIRSRVQISEEEVRALYDEVYGDQKSGGEEIHLRHILVLADGPRASTLDGACAIVEAARTEIELGENDFPTVARRVSDMNPESGGELGWMHRDDLARWMATTVRDLDPGQMSAVVEMPFGCNLLQVVDRRSFEPVSFEEAKGRLQNEIFQRKTEEQYVEWIDTLRSQTYIDRKAGFGG
jgi:peptidyl-prolyl cis-trans isomerase SurA